MKTIHRPPLAALLTAATILTVFPTLTPAQGIYRIVGPDGRITFSDKQPASSEKSTALSPSGRSIQNDAGGELPFDLREAMNRYPVTLYTGDSCDACEPARNLLNSRGVPYTERTIVTAQDIEALKRLGIEAMVPTATIGGQRLKGYSESDWSAYLDAAGYPKTSRLPSGYRNPPPSPLAPTAQTAPPPAARPTAPEPVAPPSGPTTDNPTGIVF